MRSTRSVERLPVLDIGQRYVSQCAKKHDLSVAPHALAQAGVLRLDHPRAFNTEALDFGLDPGPESHDPKTPGSCAVDGVG